MGESSVQYMIQNAIWTSAPWNKVIKKSLFSKGNLNFIKGITSEDIDWCARLAVLATTYDYIEKPYVGYRQRESSVSKAMTYDKVCCLRNNIFRIEEIVAKAQGEKRNYLYNIFLTNMEHYCLIYHYYNHQHRENKFVKRLRICGRCWDFQKAKK